MASILVATGTGTGSETSSSIPPDLIFNILSRLPVKALGKFKSVSKQWLSIITDPYFLVIYRNRSLQYPNLLLLRNCNSNDIDDDDHAAQSSSAPIQNKGTPLSHVHTAHADAHVVEVLSLGFHGNSHFLHQFQIDVNDNLLALLPSKSDLVCFAAENSFYVCNPSTQEFVKLPDPSCCTSRELNAGFGYISSTNEYVLIHLFDRSLDLSGDSDFACEIIRLNDGASAANCSWKVVDSYCPYVLRGWGVLVDNVFYWMIWEPYDHPAYEAIVSFDLDKEEFGTVSPPEGCFDPRAVWSLVELRGLLCLVDSASRPFSMDIWVLKDSVSHEWVKEYSIDLNGFGKELLDFILPLDQWDGEILMDVKQESLNCYNLENKSFKRMDNLIAGEWTWLRLYTESFFSLGSR